MILFMIFLLCIVIQILTRYVPFIKIMGTEEISVYCFIWATLMGTAVMVRKNGHFAFDFFRGKVKKLPKLVTETFIQACMIAFSVYISWCGVQLTRQFWNWSLTSLPNVSQRYTWSSLIVCGITMAFYSLCDILQTYSRYRKGESI
jgi:TRAP-type C4-dicarboxylate transport system permease small subunit